MRICIYGTRADRQLLLSAADKSKELAFRQYEADWFDDYDAFIQAVKEQKYDLTVVMKDNADGMEGVIAVKSLLPEMPVVWFSNDKQFGVQSYRLNANYFHEKPVTVQMLNNALASCKLI